jgi:hypothetical protein
MMKDLDFCIKGDRKYVQGPDIFDTVVSLLESDYKDISDLKYSAYEMLYQNGKLTVIEKFKKDKFKNLKSVITFYSNNIKLYGVVESRDEDINCSASYSEEIIRSDSKIDGKDIFFFNSLKYSLSEIVVSMNKFYLQETVTKDGKWIVTKFDFINLDVLKNIESADIKLTLKSNFQNKITRSEIFIGNNRVGNLYFSLV